MATPQDRDDSVEEFTDSQGGTYPRAARLHHIAWLVEPDEFEPFVRRLSDTVGVKLSGPWDIESVGARMAVSWDSGIEVLTTLEPGNPDNFYTARLAANGPGLDVVVFSSNDLRLDLDRVELAGLHPGRTLGMGGWEPWLTQTFDQFEEVQVDEALRVRHLLGHFVEKD